MSGMKKVKANIIIFDQGNTLFMDPFAKVIRRQSRVFRTIYRKYNLEISNAQLLDAWTQANQETHYPFIGHFAQEEPILQLALHKLGLREDTAAIMALDLLRSYRIGLKKHIVSDPRTKEIRNLLKKLKALGKRLGVFSNDRRIGLGMVLHSMSVYQYFEYIETSESIAAEKPDPRVFQHMISFFHAVPREIVYIGDDPVFDIDAAKMTGMKAIRCLVDTESYREPWRDYQRKAEWEPDATVNDLNNLLDIIE